MPLGASLAQFRICGARFTAAAALTAFKIRCTLLLVWSVGRFVLQLDALPLAVAIAYSAKRRSVPTFICSRSATSGRGRDQRRRDDVDAGSAG